MSWFRCEVDGHERRVLHLRSLDLPLDRDTAIDDLRVWQDRVMAPGSRARFPTSKWFAERWGWAKTTAYRLMIDLKAWSDPSRLEAWTAMWNANGTKVERIRNESGTEQDGQTPEDDGTRNADGTETERERNESGHRRGDPPSPSPSPVDEATQADLMFPLRLVADRGVDDSTPNPPQLSDGTKVALKAAGLSGGKALSELTQREVLAIHGVGKKRLEEITAWLASHGLKLKDAPLDEARVITACSDVWTAAWTQTQTTKYPWQLAGADRERCKQWAAALGMPAEMDAACARLDSAIRCYLDAVKAGAAWPVGDVPTTRAFTNDIAKWVIAGDRREVAPTTKKTTPNPFDARRSTEGRFKNRQ